MLVKTKESEFYLGALLKTFINGGKKRRDQFYTLPYLFSPSPDATPN